ncbi:DNA-binding transcriptional response regulator, NtrC family, contains REC, AAA-type ATPase, and a Fis-type DNA-binding domains [Psychroflexus salarius]|uniref:DNA-binding transcriptional response regulator, NtrC family, contains REC, AAA-type ATPase, and a Fis-type DNA-binding domains n=1 Tax=Psychroflexus salarius TaxID=1155689 RepID=A0A1M4VDJ8_9FLAO|nr:sigma-54 dependent transcriptional regulator [Psychroflexus salarius]SHE67051.1 DNA-binding transcriptional response regulator, NtrC family, contains REC, AAA-type ATPase, and a Fis-type DNA-binding domains [Psychroflexus salarius]
MAYSIFVIDDDPWSSKKIRHILSMNPDHDVTLFDDPFQLLSALKNQPNLICVDFLMPKMNGKQLIHEILKQNPHQDILVISGQENITNVVDLFKIGVRDYIIKTEHLKNSLWKSVENIKEKRQLKNEIKSLKSQVKKQVKEDNTIIGESIDIKILKQNIKKAATTNINIHVTGETGTGKELVAQSIYKNATQITGEFVSINVSAIPSNLIESELFGYEKGAFTGAEKSKAGLFEKAHKGLLFLDEIAELEIELQAKLLRALEERKIRRLGGRKLISVDFKLITATHKDLRTEIENGNFREDLFYRIYGFPIQLPPLRKRQKDIKLLSLHFKEIFAKQNHKKVPSISTNALKKLESYPFPGNIRELKSIIELACVLCENHTIQKNDIRLPNKTRTFISEEKTLQEHTDEIVQYYLEKYHFNVKQVAELLNIGVSTIYHLAKQKRIILK